MRGSRLPTETRSCDVARDERFSKHNVIVAISMGAGDTCASEVL